MPKFPEVLYVHKPFDGDSQYDGYPDYNDAEDGDIVAIYELKSVNKVVHKKEVFLESNILENNEDA